MLKIPVFQLGLRSSPVQSESNVDSQQMGGICKPQGMGGRGHLPAGTSCVVSIS